MKKSVWVTHQFAAYHHWKQAPEQVAFLRHDHRHMFHVRLEIEVSHNNRDVEFFMLKAELIEHIDLNFLERHDVGSCEMIAEQLYLWTKNNAYRFLSVTVSEDNENGATIRA